MPAQSDPATLMAEGLTVKTTPTSRPSPDYQETTDDYPRENPGPDVPVRDDLDKHMMAEPTFYAGNSFDIDPSQKDPTITAPKKSAERKAKSQNRPSGLIFAAR
jgi:hypothetical protein